LGHNLSLTERANSMTVPSEMVARIFFWLLSERQIRGLVDYYRTDFQMFGYDYHEYLTPVSNNTVDIYRVAIFDSVEDTTRS
jgi:hypothetical protein